jgi:hypothetical protein
MFKWDSVFEWGRRASDRPIATPVTRTRDPLLESAIAHEQIEVLYQPLIEPLSGRTVGAEALARSAVADRRPRCLAGLRRLVSTSGCRG